MNTDTGIYSITSPSGKRYIGSAASFKRRWVDHKIALRNGRHDNYKLQRAWDKYGEAAMVFEKIALCPVTDLIIVEQARIDALRPEYNIALIAVSPMRGRNHTELTRAAMAAAHKGKIRSVEHCENLSIALTGIVRNIDREALSARALAQWSDPVARRQMSMVRAGKYTGAENHMARSVACIETGIEFVTGRDAIRWLREQGFLKASPAAITNACRGKFKSAYGFTWRYAD